MATESLPESAGQSSEPRNFRELAHQYCKEHDIVGGKFAGFLFRGFTSDVVAGAGEILGDWPAGVTAIAITSGVPPEQRVPTLIGVWGALALAKIGTPNRTINAVLSLVRAGGPSVAIAGNLGPLGVSPAEAPNLITTVTALSATRAAAEQLVRPPRDPETRTGRWKIAADNVTDPIGTLVRRATGRIALSVSSEIVQKK